MAKKADKSAKGRGLKLVAFEVDPKTWKAFRIYVLRRNTTASEVLRGMITKELRGKK